MEVQAITKGARMSAQKVREVVRQIQGMGANQAVSVLQYVPRKSARLVLKTLRSAIANAENNFNLKSEDLIIKQAVALTGPSLKRWIPKARGMAGPIIKRSCHIKIVLTDSKETAETKGTDKNETVEQTETKKES
jgi:large subunit ribosomal protein L22